LTKRPDRASAKSSALARPTLTEVLAVHPRGYEQIATLEAEMNATRALVFSGRLHDPNRARKVSLAINTPIEVRPFFDSR